jgi:aminobenzoyl-glutamate utilization protein A
VTAPSRDSLSEGRRRGEGLVAEIVAETRSLEDDLVALRRDLHRHPEPGFGEFRTASVLQEKLSALGLDVKIAEEAMDPAAVFSRPEGRIDAAAERALALGVERDLVERLKRGGTALVAELRGGEGPTVAFRFDMDCLPVMESGTPEHRPSRDGFRSLVDGEMHACGHDGHMAIGVGVASVLAARRAELAGTVRLIFQPAEEGALGGARAIAARGFADDVDYLVCMHIGLGAASGEFVARAIFLATSKFRVHFAGRGAHVVNSPETGRNALLAASSAALAAHAMAPHGRGWYSVNVGVLRAGDEQGVTPPWAVLDVGLWAETEVVHDYVVERLRETMEGAGATWGVDVTIEQIGGAPAAPEDSELAELACRIAERVPAITLVRDEEICRAGEDATVLLNRVAERGGKGIYVLVGSDLAAGHHAPDFDFDEQSLGTGTALLSALALHLLGRSEAGV